MASRKQRKRKQKARRQASRPHINNVLDFPIGRVAVHGRFAHVSNNATPEEHAEFRATLLAAKPDIEARLSAARERLVEILRTVDPADLVARASLVYLNFDPNTYREWEDDRSPGHVEYLALQALAVGLDSSPTVHPAEAPQLTDEAIDLARRVEPHNIHWFEEPVSPLDAQAYLDVKAATNIPLAGGECEYTRFGFQKWFDARALDYAQPDVCACGGITESMKIATLASLAGIHVTPHVWGSAIGQAAALHFYAARPRQPFTLTPEAKLIECDRTENPFRTEIVETPIRLDGGCWHLPEAAGLGIGVVPERFEPYLVGRVS